ncbi:hypothetical protein ON003_00150 [Janibacter hoylei]|uniref:hypothetical protein n=1 Tax=Janibacter hoylei TaxID=364298 RepID=UPI002238AA60|nr:hypothetical protein [Janibacter hoylei]MCW4600195.1 hypothetical protein [Janibacter hoylei]
MTTSPPPPTRSGVPLKDRPTGADEPQRPDGGPVARRRHCWVTDLDGVEHEGLVLQWAQEGAGEWVALVAYVVSQPGRDRTVQEWAEARRLRPAQ